MNAIPTFPLAKYIDAILNFFTDNFSFITKGISDVTKVGLDYFEAGLFIITSYCNDNFNLSTNLFYYKQRCCCTFFGRTSADLEYWTLGCYYEYFVFSFGATIIAVGIGLPLGILVALNDRANKIVMPILDFMQTIRIRLPNTSLYLFRSWKSVSCFCYSYIWNASGNKTYKLRYSSGS